MMLLLLYRQGIATVSLLFPHRHVAVTREDAVCILSEENPYLDKLSESTQQALAEIGQWDSLSCHSLRTNSVGSLVMS